MCSSDKCWFKSVCDVSSDICTSTCVKFLKMEYMMQNSNIPENKQRPLALYPSECDLQAFNRLAEIKSDMRDFVWNGKNLYITSKITGNGKSSWAMKLLMRYFDEMSEEDGKEIRGLFIHVPTFLIKLKDFNTTDEQFEDMKKLLPTVDLVIWDDIAGTNMSNYDYSQLLVYIDNRALNDLSNIYTGNLTSREDIASALGSKIASRIWNSNTEVVEFHGGDRR